LFIHLSSFIFHLLFRVSPLLPLQSQTMATTVAAPTLRGGRLRTVLKIVSLLVALAVFSVAAITLWFYITARGSLAQLDGEISIVGLKAPVQVIRDTHGVPHLNATSNEDLFFAQGYVTAQDRLWQMDMTRRAMAGELAEILPAASAPPSFASRLKGTPPSWVDYDKQQRILRLRPVAERVAAQLSDRDRAFFTAYAAGVNAYIEQHRNKLPIEFHVLGYAPRPWTPADSVLIGIGMSQLLNPQFEMEWTREKMARLLSPELMADLYPVSSPRDHAPASDAAPLPSAVTPAHRKAASAWRTAEPGPSSLPLPASNHDCEACIPGSNNWVISGAHTTTGKPLLSNDMHLPHREPSMWYEAHLHAAGFNVEGFTLPGMPFVIVGHNQRIAWGYTNLNPDVQDLFIEEFNAAGEYQTPSGWQKPEVIRETIHVKGAPDVPFDVRVTRHGPIITSLLPGETREIALQWVIYDSRNISIPLFDLDSAQNWEQFRKALSVFATPSQNVVYGDLDGNIGYQPMGFVPVRAAGDGTLPVSGADGQHDWTGYLDFDKLPAVYNPPGGIIATANSKITPEGYPYLLATQWFPPYRTERIYKVLQQPGRKFSPADMLALQTDITSEYDRSFASHFAYAIAHSSKANDRLRQAGELLRNFDGRMAAESAAPTIEVKSRTALRKILLQPKLGKAWEEYTWSESAVALETIVETQPKRWLAPGYANFDDMLTAAVEKAIEDAPADLKTWKYGEQFPLVIDHPLFGVVPVLRGMSAPGRHPQSGGGYTVKQVGRGFGPSERMTVDFSNLDASTFNIVIGESGQIFSPHYMDHWPAWYNNQTFTLAYSDEAVQGARMHNLRLLPGK
jgi:penicillin G amidase